MATDPKETRDASEQKSEQRGDEPAERRMLPPLPFKKVCTIGYTKKSAEVFFTLLKEAGVIFLIDIRANASYGISGYTFRRDFEYFCKLHAISLVVLEILSPSRNIREAFKRTGDWGAYTKSFIELLGRRKAFADENVKKVLFNPNDNDGAVCFLCAEPTADKCHRRLVVERLLEFLPNADEIEIVHL